MYAYQGICRLNDDDTERPCELQVEGELLDGATEWFAETSGRIDESVELPDRDTVAVSFEVDGQELRGEARVRDKAEMPDSQRSERYPRRFELVGTNPLRKE